MLANGHNHSDFVCPLSDCSGLVCQNRIMGLIKIVEREQQELFLFRDLLLVYSQGSIIILGKIVKIAPQLRISAQFGPLTMKTNLIFELS